MCPLWLLYHGSRSVVADSGDCGLCTELYQCYGVSQLMGDAFELLMVVYNEAVLSGPCS